MASGAGRSFRHDFEQPEFYHRLIEERMRERGITRAEAYRQFIDEARGRSALRVNMTRERCRSIKDRAAALARSIGGAAGPELAALIADARRIEELI